MNGFLKRRFIYALVAAVSLFVMSSGAQAQQAATFASSQVASRITGPIDIKREHGTDEPFEHYNAAQPVYTEPDYMDFAERYADYVCSYEKGHSLSEES